jgi:glycosyltransferase 2 family protein
MIDGASNDGTPAAEPLQTPLERWRLKARLALGLIAFAFVAFACYTLASRWDGSAVELRWGYLLAAPLPLWLGVTVLALGWKSLLQSMTTRVLPLRPTLALHVESQIARYMPGKVGIPLMRMAGASEVGAPATAVGYSVLLETISMLAAGGVVGCAGLLLAREAGTALRSLSALGLLGLLGFGAVTLVLVCVDRRRYPARVLRVLGAEGVGPLVPWQMPAAHVGYWIAWAVHGYLCARAVGVPHAAAFAASGFYVLAPVMGFLALVAPSGIGVREALLSMALTPAVGPALALSTAVLSRAVSLLADVAAWFLARLWRARLRV